MEEHLSVGLSVMELCKLVNVKRSSYYFWCSNAEKRILSAKQEAELLIKIRKVFLDSKKTYGSPRVWRQLLRDGVSCSKDQVAKIMRKNSLISVHFKRKRRFTTTTDSTKTLKPAPNLLKQNFSCSAPNQKWVGDVTQFITGEGWLYFATMIDLFSRKVIGYALGARNNAQLACAAFKMALLRREQATQLIYHSDRGSIYDSNDFKSLLAHNNITPSMSRKGNCYDNAVAESFFHTVKVELINRMEYKTKISALASITNWIEDFYNTKRMHSAIEYCSPVEFELIHTGFK